MCIGKSCHYKDSELHFCFSKIHPSLRKSFEIAKLEFFGFSQTVGVNSEADPTKMKGEWWCREGWKRRKEINFENPKNIRLVQTTQLGSCEQDNVKQHFFYKEKENLSCKLQHFKVCSLVLRYSTWKCILVKYKNSIFINIINSPKSIRRSMWWHLNFLFEMSKNRKYCIICSVTIYSIDSKL